MKQVGVFFVGLFILCMVVNVFSEDLSALSEYDKAIWYLNDRNEVVVKTYVENRQEVDLLAQSFLVDKFEGVTVYIYLHKEDFTDFLKLMKPYEVFEDIKAPGYYDVTLPEDRQSVVSYPANNSPYSTYEAMVNKLETTYPNLCKVSEVGQTVNGVKIYCVKVSNNPGVDQKKPRFLGTGTMHGNEQAGMHCILRLIEWLASQYQKDAQATKIVDSTEMYFIPLVNPEGSYPGGTFNIASSVRKTPKCNDINRSFPVPSCSNTGAAVYPAGDKEREAIINLAKQKTFQLGFDLHTGMTAVVLPWSCTGTGSNKHPDFDGYLKPVGTTFSTKSGGGLQVDWAFIGWYEGQGTIFDYMNSLGGGRNFCVELTSQQKNDATTSEGCWTKFKLGFLYLLEQIQFGIHGTILSNGKPVKAKIAVDTWDKFDSQVYSNTDCGYFSRPIQAGTYSLTITYTTYTIKIPNVKVEANKKTDIGTIEMTGTGVQSLNGLQTRKDLRVVQNRQSLSFINNTSSEVLFCVYTLAGEKVYSQSVAKASVFQTNLLSTNTASGSFVVTVSNRAINYSQHLLLR